MDFIIDSARKHGVADDDIWNCYLHPIVEVYREEDGLFVCFGFDLAGRPTEVAYLTRTDGAHVIVHALRRRTPPAQ